MTSPLVAVTLGDPAGVGPEIIAKTFAEAGFPEENRAMVVGDEVILKRAVNLLGLNLDINVVSVPIKLLGFESGVNVTVGLPFFRTSVDHGTAFDIAGTGKADHTSLQAALDLARVLANPGEDEGS